MSAIDEVNVPVSSRKRNFPVWRLIIAVVVLGLGYMLYTRLMPTPQAMPPQGPVPVVAVTVQSEPVQTWNDFSARTRAVDEAEIKPEVGGRITEIRFQDGQDVKAGDILLVIDPRPYEAALARAKAALVTAQTNATFAKTELGRAQGMIKTQAIAQRLYDQRVDEARTAGASVQSAQADVDTASLNVEHAYVRAPITGRTGRTELTVGNLVDAGPNAPVLTSIVSTDGIYADFEVDEQTYMRAVHATADNRAEEQKIPVQLTVNDVGGKSYQGTIYSFDNHIDSATSTIRARAKFANEDGSLVPGMFVSVRLAGAQAVTAVTVPELAVQTDQNKKFVYTIKDGKAQYTPVVLGQALGANHIVLSGLSGGDQVITDGIQHLQPGAPVMTTAPVPPPATTAK